MLIFTLLSELLWACQDIVTHWGAWLDHKNTMPLWGVYYFSSGVGSEFCAAPESVEKHSVIIPCQNEGEVSAVVYWSRSSWSFGCWDGRQVTPSNSRLQVLGWCEEHKEAAADGLVCRLLCSLCCNYFAEVTAELRGMWLHGDVIYLHCCREWTGAMICAGVWWNDYSRETSWTLITLHMAMNGFVLFFFLFDCMFSL